MICCIFEECARYAALKIECLHALTYTSLEMSDLVGFALEATSRASIGVLYW